MSDPSFTWQGQARSASPGPSNEVWLRFDSDQVPAVDDLVMVYVEVEDIDTEFGPADGWTLDSELLSVGIRSLTLHHVVASDEPEMLASGLPYIIGTLSVPSAWRCAAGAATPPTGWGAEDDPTELPWTTS